MATFQPKNLPWSMPMSAITTLNITAAFRNGGIVGEGDAKANALVSKVDQVATSQGRPWNGSKELMDISLALNQKADSNGHCPCRVMSELAAERNKKAVDDESDYHRSADPGQYLCEVCPSAFFFTDRSVVHKK
jgi:hypothetical protein